MCLPDFDTTDIKQNLLNYAERDSTLYSSVGGHKTIKLGDVFNEHNQVNHHHIEEGLHPIPDETSPTLSSHILRNILDTDSVHLFAWETTVL